MLHKQALLQAVASERYTRQIISLGTSAPTFDNAAGATSINVNWPAAGSVAANTRTFISLALKPGTANLGNIPTPAGWTFVASHIGGGYGATLGVSTGNTRIFLFMKDGDNTSAGSLNVPITPDGANGVCAGCMQRIEKSKLALVWQPIVISKGDATTAGTNVSSFTPTPPIGVSRGDFLIYGFSIGYYFLGGTTLNAGAGLVGASPSLANGGADQFGYQVNSVCTGRRATRGLQAITDPQLHTAPVGVENRGPMIIARMRVR